MMIGHLTRDVELKYLPNQTAVSDFGIAATRKFKAQDGSQKEETCFVDCQIFGKLAETVNKYVKKGDPLFIQGRLKFESWTKQDGARATKHRIVVESFQMLSDKRSEATGASNSEIETHKESDDIPF